MALVYRANPVTHLHWIDWEEEFVVFDETSGQTHLLDPLRAYALNAMTNMPRDVNGLLIELAGLGLAEKVECGRLREALETALAEFDRLGLVHVVAV